MSQMQSRYSSCSEVLLVVPQDSMLLPFLLNVFTCDMFYFLEDFDIANYVDDCTPHNVTKNIEFVVNNLEQSLSVLFKWLKITT